MELHVIKVNNNNLTHYTNVDFTNWLLKFNINNNPLIEEFIDDFLTNTDLEINFSNDILKIK